MLNLPYSSVPTIFTISTTLVKPAIPGNTFVIASSYSGNTEETLSAYNECLKRKCSSIVISTGGELTQIATDNKVGVIKLPIGYQPRAAVGYSLSILLLLFVEMGLISEEILEEYYITDELSGKASFPKLQSDVDMVNKRSPSFPIPLNGLEKISSNE